jgi:hypothetical protein
MQLYLLEELWYSVLELLRGDWTMSSAHASRRATKKKNKVTVDLSRKQVKKPDPADIYWPDRIDYVRAVAARGLTDTEMAAFLNVPASLLDSWKAYYPLFAEAIEEGRSQADIEVIQALHKNAVGFEYETDEVIRTRRGAEVITAKRFMPPDTNAQKYWLTNRSPAWRVAQNVNLGGQRGGEPIKVDTETKMMVIHSILNMITPRPDGDGKPPKLIKPE